MWSQGRPTRGAFGGGSHSLSTSRTYFSAWSESHLRERVAVEDAAPSSLVDGAAKLTHLGGVVITKLERIQASAKDILDAGRETGGNLRLGKPKKFVRQTDMTHG